MSDGVVSEIFFEADEDYGDVGAAFEDFGVPANIVWSVSSKMAGTPVVAVAHHFVVMLCRESGLLTEKAIKMTCAWL